MRNLDNAVCGKSIFRDSELLKCLLNDISKALHGTPMKIMEVCGGQTASIVKNGLEELFSPGVRMVHGPGCPVCVTPQYKIDAAIEIASRKDVIMCSFGDMMRVPGSTGSLLDARAAGADVRILYSPLDCISISMANPDKEVIFFAVGFETTMPIYALLIKAAIKNEIKNLSLITSLFTVPQAVKAIVNDPDCEIEALLAAGHVCAVMGTEEYDELSAELKIPIIVTGFEPVDILQGILYAARQREKGIYRVENPYYRVAHNNGNPIARRDIEEIFVNDDVEWRGIGIIPRSGKCLADRYELYDATKRFSLKNRELKNMERCISGALMKGVKLPKDCPCFNTSCTPEHPIGAPMVSSEGICAAYYSNSYII